MAKYDIAVLGGGPGGYFAAIYAAKFNKKVCLIEKDSVGGTCLNRGCIPSKALLASSHVYHLAKKQAKDFGVEILGEVKPNLRLMMDRKMKIQTQLVKGVEGLLKRGKVEWKKGHGRLTGANTLEVNGGKVEADHIILAPGSYPIVLDIPGLSGENIWNSDDALVAERVPNSLMVIGAGAVGLELGQFYHELGAELTVVEMLPTIAPLVDPEVSKVLHQEMENSGVEILTECKAKSAKPGPLGWIVTVEQNVPHGQTGLKSSQVTAEVVLQAAGRGRATKDCGLEKVGIEMERERIKTDEYMRTNVPHIYAVGDCTTPMMLAHVAFKEAEVAVDHIVGHAHKMRYNAMPNVIYTHPEIATVGMTEQQAKEAGYEVEVGRYNFAANGRSLSENSKVGFAKCVIDKKSKEVLGVHCVGHYVSELISGPASVIGLEANIEEVLSRFVHPHPTLSEVTYEAYADSIGMAVHK